MRIGLSCNLWLVCNADHLAARGEFFHDDAYLFCGFAGNARINFIKNKRGHIHALSNQTFNAKHQAAEFAAACYFTHGFKLATFVSVKQKFDCIFTGDTRFFILNRNF